MKGALIAAVSLLSLASAQPAHRHRAFHQKRDAVTVVNTVIAQASGEPVVVVYVDDDGKPVSTTTRGLPQALYTNTGTVPAASKTAAAAPVVLKEAGVVHPSSSVVVAPTTQTTAAPAASSPASSSGSSSGAVANGMGVAYGPYKADGSCKNAAQVLKDFAGFPSGVGFVRTYGADGCSPVSTVYAACKSTGLKHFIGVFNPRSALAQELSDIKTAVNGDWSNVYAISIGNELVNGAQATAAEVIAWVNSARSTLRGWGYTGPVVTVDTLVATKASPSLCDASDFCAVNCHPYFDGGVSSDGAGSFVTSQMAQLKSKLANQSQKIVIAETGWPWQGDSNGKAHASTADQTAALASIKTAFSGNPAGVSILSVFNEPWKKSTAGQFEAEPYWGFAGSAPTG